MNMKKLLWPGIVFVLVGSLVVLHAVTIVYAVSKPPAAGAASDARPRAGWTVRVTTQGVTLIDASARPIDDAEVSINGVTLTGTGDGRYVGPPPNTPTVRVRVERRGRAWTFDRSVEETRS